MTVSDAGGEGEARTLADRVFRALRKAIVEGDLAPGQKLSEAEVARLYGVSRGPLREAMRRLQARRLLEFSPHVGARVTSLSFAALLEIYEVREALEGMACRLATERMARHELDDLHRLLDVHAEADEFVAGERYAGQDGDIDFHYRIVRGSRNAVLVNLLCEDLYDLLRMYRYKFGAWPGRPERALVEHRRIVAAMADGDPELAELLMRRHIDSARRSIREAWHATGGARAEPDRATAGVATRQRPSGPSGAGPQPAHNPPTPSFHRSTTR